MPSSPLASQPASPFASPEAFRTAFTGGLQRLLDEDALGVFILVLANASFDRAIFDQLHDALGARFADWAERFRQHYRAGQEVEQPDDDVLVFLKLLALGFEHIGATEFGRAGPWELQFNLLRAFRPNRISSAAVPGIRREFDPNGFNFNRPFLRRETFWSGQLIGHQVDLLYNKFPFAELHGLLVPEREAQQPQCLTPDYHQLVWALTAELGETLPGVGFAYNSLGAFASVNHLHFQMFVREQRLPAQEPRWQHNGGSEPYPARCERFESADEAWNALTELQHCNVPYNLIYQPGAVLCLPRRPQGSYDPVPWSGGFAWYEMAGGVTTFSKPDFLALDEATIGDELRRVGSPEAGYG